MLPKANPDDRRYHGWRWRKTRAKVIRRDGGLCWAKEQQTDGTLIPCPAPGIVADHVYPVYPGMPDHEFYSMGNLRASCQRHNTARGIAARLHRETEQGVGTTKVGVRTPSRTLARTHGFFRRA